MLVLSRNIGETVVINDDTRITFLGIKGQQIRLGFEAPREVIIHREEIQQRISRENRGTKTLSLSLA